MIQHQFQNIDLLKNRGEFSQLWPISEAEKITVGGLSACYGLAENNRGIYNRYAAEYELPELFIGEVSMGAINHLGMIEKAKRSIYSASQFPNPDNFLKQLNRPYSAEISVGSVIPLYRPGDHIYGHWLVDILPKVWLLKQQNCFEGYKFLVKKTIPPYAKQLLALLGVDEEQLVLVEPGANVFFEKALFVPNLRFNQVFHPIMRDFIKDFSRLMDTHARESSGNLIVTPSTKIYLSRNRWNKFKPAKIRALVNAQDVEAMYMAHGYEIVYPEELSFAEQYLVFQKAQIMAGEDGSALHNCIFMKPESAVQCLRGEKNHSLIQGALCDVSHQRIDYIFGQNQGGDQTRNASYSIPLDALEKLLSGEAK